MKVTIELDEDIIYAIAQKKGIENGYDWSCNEDFKDINYAYALAFQDGMEYILNLINQQEQQC